MIPFGASLHSFFPEPIACDDRKGNVHPKRVNRRNCSAHGGCRKCDLRRPKARVKHEGGRGMPAGMALIYTFWQVATWQPLCVNPLFTVLVLCGFGFRMEQMGHINKRKKKEKSSRLLRRRRKTQEHTAIAPITTSFMCRITPCFCC